MRIKVYIETPQHVINVMDINLHFVSVVFEPVYQGMYAFCVGSLWVSLLSIHAFCISWHRVSLSGSHAFCVSCLWARLTGKQTIHTALCSRRGDGRSMVAASLLLAAAYEPPRKEINLSIRARTNCRTSHPVIKFFHRLILSHLTSQRGHHDYFAVVAVQNIQILL